MCSISCASIEAHTPFVCPLKQRSRVPVARSNNRTVLSSLADATTRPSGEMSTSYTCRTRAQQSEAEVPLRKTPSHRVSVSRAFNSHSGLRQSVCEGLRRRRRDDKRNHAHLKDQCTEKDGDEGCWRLSSVRSFGFFFFLDVMGCIVYTQKRSRTTQPVSQQLHLL
jgi:hypothetical protein